MNVAIIAAGGVGERFGEPGGKQLALAAGAPVLSHTLRAFEACAAVDAIVVVVDPDRIDEYRSAAVDAVGARKVIAVVGGGATRGASVAAGLGALPSGADLVAVHDGARAAITPDVITAAFGALAADPALDGVVVGHPALDTIKRVGVDDVVAETPDRASLWIAQTPQVFRAGVLRRAHERAAGDGFAGTDDASLVERYGGRVRMIAGPRWNMKVTLKEDLAVLESVLASRSTEGE